VTVEWSQWTLDLTVGSAVYKYIVSFDLSLVSTVCVILVVNDYLRYLGGGNI